MDKGNFLAYPVRFKDMDYWNTLFGLKDTLITYNNKF